MKMKDTNTDALEHAHIQKRMCVLCTCFERMRFITFHFFSDTVYIIVLCV